MPSLSLVSSIVLALIVFSALRAVFGGIHDFIVDWLKDVQRIKTEQRERGIGTK
jgi:hypothetical protein